MDDSQKQIPDPGVFEKLGVFYLGAERDSVASGTMQPVLYDSRDLTTHAVCVGMTGSGKTGLCTCLLEEAALDGVPAIIIDPKGDLANLLLSFPDLSAESFEPWVDPGNAERKGQSVAEYAAATAELWRKGLAGWGEDGERIAALRRAVEMRIYTPGSDSGLQLSVLKSFSAPPAEIVNDGDAFRERISGSVSGLLTLLGIDADPLRSREHILLASILEHEWKAGRDCGLPELIRMISTPPFTQVGILDLESFFPGKERMDLAVTLNNLLASPSFGAWAVGEPLDVQSLLWSPEGKPRLSILYIAHLSEAERMFFVTLLLNEVVSWVRRQTGTGSLRALLYMDEVFGYLPPVANPPSKAPMLTLLKQARAFGLGLVLATQNPVDLDYKALSNAGTWLLGRLQTERDKQRMIDGLIGAQGGSGLDREALLATISGLDSREFLLHNVHDDGPLVMATRWAMSYLRGPLSRDHVRRLMQGAEPDPVEQSPAPAPAPEKHAVQEAADMEQAGVAERPLLPKEAGECFQQAALPEGAAVHYEPALWGSLTLHYVDSKRGWDEWRECDVLARINQDSGADPWDDAVLSGKLDCSDRPASEAGYGELPARALQAYGYGTWRKSLEGHAYQAMGMELLECPELKLYSRPGENQRDFTARLSQQLREDRDGAMQKLRAEYDRKIDRIEERLDSAERKLAEEQQDYAEKKMDSYFSVGGAILDTVFGTRRVTKRKLDRARTAARSVGRAGRGKGDIAEAQEKVHKYELELDELKSELEEKLFELQQAYSLGNLKIEKLNLAPRKSDISVNSLRLVWLPRIAAQD
ncbi:DUF87 domain-containing protein [bacterium]|nr:DUF87 domain-containing protein [bacterium]